MNKGGGGPQNKGEGSLRQGTRGAQAPGAPTQQRGGAAHCPEMDSPGRYACFACRTTRWAGYFTPEYRPNCRQCHAPMPPVKATRRIPEISEDAAWAKLQSHSAQHEAELTALLVSRREAVAQFIAAHKRGPSLIKGTGAAKSPAKGAVKSAAKFPGHLD